MLHSLYHLARPKLLPFVLFLTGMGYGWAHWDRAVSLRGISAYLIVMASWSLLHAGTLWLNAALDRDEGEVLMGQSVPVPDHIVWWGYAALLGCIWVGFQAGQAVGLAATACAVLAVLYSHPRTMWKAHPLFGPLVNWLGYGLLSPYVGWVVVGLPSNPRTVAVWFIASLGTLGCYFAAQAFQEEEDSSRGYRTLVATHGPRTAVQTGRLCLGLGFTGGLVLIALGWLPRVCLLAAFPLGFWVDAWMAEWAAEPDGGGEAWARGTIWRLVFTGVVGLSLAFGEYARASFAGEPVAGLGTAAGHPTDRPLLSPPHMRAWEHRTGDVILRP